MLLDISKDKEMAISSQIIANSNFTKMRFIISIGLVVVLFQTACKENIDDINEGIQKQEYTLVRTAEIEISNAPIPIYAIGKVQSDRDIKLSFKIGGIISSLTVDEGDYVKKGTLLGSIRTNEIDAQVLKANRALEKAKRDLARVQKMYDDGAATLENVQDLTTLVAVSEADLDIAQFNQQYAKVVSPVSGRILQRLAEPNELIGPGQPIYILSSSSGGNYIMSASLSDRDINRVNYKDRVEVLFDAFPGKVINGSITQINESADPRTGTFNIEVSLLGNKNRIRNGTIGRINILPENTSELGRIPIEAVVETKDNSIIVFSPIENDTIAREWSAQPVRIIDDFVLVDSDEVRYTNVITDGASYLIDGDQIKIDQNNPPTKKQIVDNQNSKNSSAKSDCMIITGAYALSSNVDNMIQRLSDDNHETFTQPFGSLTQVGLYVSCDSDRSNEILSAIRSKFAPDAVLLNSSID